MNTHVLRFSSCVTAALLSACAPASSETSSSTPSEVPSSTNPLLAAWTGPYGGVPAFEVEPQGYPCSFSDAQSEEFDALYKEKLHGLGLSFDFGGGLVM